MKNQQSLWRSQIAQNIIKSVERFVKRLHLLAFSFDARNGWLDVARWRYSNMFGCWRRPSSRKLSWTFWWNVGIGFRILKRKFCWKYLRLPCIQTVGQHHSAIILYTAWNVFGFSARSVLDLHQSCSDHTQQIRKPWKLHITLNFLHMVSFFYCDYS